MKFECKIRGTKRSIPGEIFFYNQFIRRKEPPRDECDKADKELQVTLKCSATSHQIRRWNFINDCYKGEIKHAHQRVGFGRHQYKNKLNEQP